MEQSNIFSNNFVAFQTLQKSLQRLLLNPEYHKHNKKRQPRDNLLGELSRNLIQKLFPFHHL
jgi:hypothetical protein